MPNSVNFTAWNIDPAFSAGAILNSPAGWTSQNNPSSTSFFGAPGSEVDLGNYLVSVEIIDADGDGVVRPNPADTVIINGVSSGISAVWVGDRITIDGNAFEVVTFYTTDGNAFALPFAVSDGTLSQAFAGMMSGTEYIYTSSEVALPFTELENLPELCLMQGTRVRTECGERPVEDLRAGDLVQTVWNGLQPLRWVMDMPLRQAPVRVAAGALGAGLPRADLMVSAQHRVLVGRGGVAEGLVPAVGLCRLAGVRRAAGVLRRGKGRMFHLLFDRHEIILAEGLAVESLLLAPGSLESLGPVARADAFAALGRVLPRRGAGKAGQWPSVMAPATRLLTPGQIARLKPREIHGFGALVPAPDLAVAPARGVVGKGIRAVDTDVLAIPLKHC